MGEAAGREPGPLLKGPPVSTLPPQVQPATHAQAWTGSRQGLGQEVGFFRASPRDVF